MVSAAKGRESREARERGRLYQARQEFHAGQSRRRTRDNVIAGVAGGILILAVAAAQTAYFVAGPGVPVPTPTSSQPAAPLPEPSASVPVELPLEPSPGASVPAG